eukprot:100937-Pelagomonas_calceolata.AAC.8
MQSICTGKAKGERVGQAALESHTHTQAQIMELACGCRMPAMPCTALESGGRQQKNADRKPYNGLQVFNAQGLLQHGHIRARLLQLSCPRRQVQQCNPFPFLSLARANTYMQRAGRSAQERKATGLEQTCSIQSPRHVYLSTA